MSDEQTPPPGPEQPAPAGEPPESVGSVGEEAAKLFGALSDWARTQGGSYAGAATEAASHVSATLHDLDDHIATEGAECSWCPLCRTIHVVRGTSPEVRAHLSQAASSLMQAIAGMLAPPPRSSDADGIERIDLDDGAWGDDT